MQFRTMPARMYDTPFGDAFFTSCVCLLISFAATPQRLPYRAVGESLPLLQRQLLRPAKWQTVVPACRAAFSSFLNPSCSHFMRRVDVLEQSSGPAGWRGACPIQSGRSPPACHARTRIGLPAG